jgi:hypothetical protein
MPSFLANIISNGHPLALAMDGAISLLSGHNGKGGWKNPDRIVLRKVVLLPVFLHLVGIPFG